MMKNTILYIAATSPEDLSEKLMEALIQDQRYRYVSLSISGPDVLVQPFNIPGINVKDVKDRLKIVSVELLNLPGEEIAFDFQILSADDNQVSGLFACAPKSLVEKYVNVVKGAKLVPLKMTAYILSSLEVFYQQNSAQTKRFCLLDFTREGYLNLAVIHQQKFELLRKVPYENEHDALFEIMQSLRSACAKSSVKHFDQIYCTGDIPQKEKIISEIEGNFDTKALCKNEGCVKEALSEDHHFFSINLIRYDAVSLKTRKKLLVGINVLVAILILACLNNLRVVHKSRKMIQQLNQTNQSLLYSDGDNRLR